MKKSVSRILAVMLALTMLLSINAFCIGYTPAQKAQLKFNDDGEFRIMQIADIQDNLHIRRTTINFIKYAIEKNNPDLIVLTGDNIAGYWNATGIFFDCDKTLVKESIDNYMSVFEHYYEDENYNLKGVATVFGNHDDQLTSVSKEAQIEIYSQYDCYIGCDEAVDNIKIDGVGNYTIPIYKAYYEAKEEEIDYTDVAFELYMIDSNSYFETFNLKEYDGVHENQIQWFVNHAQEVNDEAGRTIHSMAFQHIIVPEIFDALKEVSSDTEGAVDCDGKYYVLPEGATGFLHEKPCPAEINHYYGEYEQLTNAGTIAFCFGHDHDNNFVLNYNGADMIMTSGVGYCSYGDDLRGVRIIDLKQDGDNVTYTTYNEFVFDENGYSSNPLSELEATVDAREISFIDRIKAIFNYIVDFFKNLFS